MDLDLRGRTAVGDGYLSLAQELFSEQLSKEAWTKLEDFLRRAIGSYEKALLNPTSNTELREKTEANLQRAQDMLHALEALEEYLAGETVSLDEILKGEEGLGGD